MYSIIDIETTGGRPEFDRITEIAIIVHDGEKVVKSYSTLINPECSIPYSITRLTGINNEMVRHSPKFFEVAKTILELIKDTTFVAHNVRFDYSFVKAAYKNLGYNFNAETLCTVRMSRKAFPGLPSYSLGKLCASLGIRAENSHRAMGDAQATVLLFDQIIVRDSSLLSPSSLEKEKRLTPIPPMLDSSVYETIPEGKIGVYYFHDQSGDVIYIGKSKDIKKRVKQHFSLRGKESRLSMPLKQEIADISIVETGSEFIALLLESDEIKKWRPKYNISQKKINAIPFYGIFESIDQHGYINLAVERLKENDEPLSTYNSIDKAKEFLYKQIELYQLCLAKCGLHNTGGSCFNWHIKKCDGACTAIEPSDVYNKRVRKAIENFSIKNESFFIVSEGKAKNEVALVCIENGQYKGFGYVNSDFQKLSMVELMASIQHYPNNRDVQNIICGVLRKKHHKISFG